MKPLISSSALQLALITVSDRHYANHGADNHAHNNANSADTGAMLSDTLQAQGHQLYQRLFVREDRYQIRAAVSALIADPACQVILLCGGTGFHAKNCTNEAISVLFDREIPGFGELFRQLSFAQIGSAALQSGAVAGIANQTLIFAMPGSRDAAFLATEQLIWPQLQAHTSPCNFTGLLRRQGPCVAAPLQGAPNA